MKPPQSDNSPTQLLAASRAAYIGLYDQADRGFGNWGSNAASPKKHKREIPRASQWQEPIEQCELSTLNSHRTTSHKTRWSNEQKQQIRWISRNSH